jgi:hypothetical protein
LESSHGRTCAGLVECRSNASGGQTVWLHAGESRKIVFDLAVGASYEVRVRYSNDNDGPLETVTVTVDGAPVGDFQAQDTGDFGNGWNVFLSSGSIGVVDLSAGSHAVTLSVTGGDGFGVEIDDVSFELHPGS